MGEQGGGYAAGWYPNPSGGPGLRWYDGSRWTDDYHHDQPPPPGSGRGYTPQPYPPAGTGGYPGYGGQGYGGYPQAAYGAPPPKTPWGYFMYALTENYANFEGRARRSEYWWFMLIGFGLFAVGVFVAAILAASIDNAAPLGLVVVVWFFGILVPSLAVTVRRLHDSNKSGWWLLIHLVPFGGIVILILLLIEGDRGPNQYGWPQK